MKKNTNIVFKIDPKIKTVTVFNLSPKQIQKIKSAFLNWLDEDYIYSKLARELDLDRAFIIRDDNSIKLKSPLLLLWWALYYKDWKQRVDEDTLRDLINEALNTKL